MKALLLCGLVGCAGDLIRKDEVVEVHGCDALAEALAEAHGARFAARGTLTLQLRGDVSSDCTHPLVVSHPQGGHLRIVGPEDDPGSYTLHVLHGGHGLEVEGGGLGLLRGVTLENQLDESARDAMGILVRDHAEVVLGRGLILRDFPIGVRAAYGASIAAPTLEVEPGVLLISGSGSYGVLASDGAHVVLPDACIDLDRRGECVNVESACKQKAPGISSLAGGVVARGASFVDVSGTVVRCSAGHGVIGTEGSVLRTNQISVYSSAASGIVSSGGTTIFGANMMSFRNAEYGFLSEAGSLIQASDAVSAENGQRGFVARNHSAIDARRARAIGNGELAFFSWMKSTIYAENVMFEGNGAALEPSHRLDAFPALASSIFLRNPVTKTIRISVCPMSLQPTEQSFLFWEGSYTMVSTEEPHDASGRSCVGPGVEKALAWEQLPRAPTTP